MICINCEKETCKTKTVRMGQEYKGKNIFVYTEATVCLICDFCHMDDDQTNALMKKIREAYGRNIIKNMSDPPDYKPPVSSS